MTPMIDVVFLLIIFFLVSTHLRKQEEREVDLSTATQGEKLSEMRDREIVINVVKEGEVFLGSRRVTVEQLPRRLQSDTTAVGAERAVRIRCARQVPYRVVGPILLACAKAKIGNVKISVFVTQGGR
jgi:biopolymer transport protein ExbD